MYEKLIAELREYWNDGTEGLRNQAADAIEELQKQLREEKVDNVNLTGWLAEEHANQCPHYIRNVHDRGDDSLCEKYRCEVKALPKWIPVTERLPEDRTRALVMRLDYVTNTPFYDLLWFEKGEWWNRRDTGDYAVTHWMPLPPPPKGAQDSVFESMKRGLEQAINGETRSETLTLTKDGET